MADFLCIFSGLPCVCGCVLISLPYKDTKGIGSVLMQVVSFHFNDLFRDSISKCSHILKWWTLEPQHMNLWGHNSAHNSNFKKWLVLHEKLVWHIIVKFWWAAFALRNFAKLKKINNFYFNKLYFRAKVWKLFWGCGLDGNSTHSLFITRQALTKEDTKAFWKT